MPDDTKKCPYCAETIKAEAIVCRFCGRDLPSGNLVPQNAAIPGATTVQPQKGKLNPLVILFLVLFGACIVIWATTRTGPISSSSSRSNTSAGTVYAKDFVKTTNDDWDCSHNSIGDMIFEGKVRNTSSTYELRFVELRATVLTRTNEVVNTDTGYIDSDVLAPGSTSTFTIYVDDPSGVGTTCRVGVEDAAFNR